jgi:hypothetical protein
MNGGRLVGAITLALFVLFFGILALAGTEESGVRLLTRATVRAAFPLFLLAYVASSARRLWPSDATKWLLRNRRYLGISFGIAMALHLDAIWLLSILLGDSFGSPITTVLFGGLAYVFIAAMTLTSFDRTAAWLGPQLWNKLHRAGIHYVGIVFLVQWLGKVTESMLYLPILLAMLGAFAVRFAARRQRSAARDASATAPA